MPTKLRVSESEYLKKFTGEVPSYEYVNGEVCQKRAMTERRHVTVAKTILLALADYERQAGGFAGPDPTTNLSDGADRRYRAPDVAYWAPGKPVGEDVFLPPTLAVEILSPGQTMAQLRDKCREYRSRGVDVCWLIEPDAKRVQVFEAGREGEEIPSEGTLESPHLPGFELTLAVLFAGL